jgi:hypothetical protein
MFDHGAQSLRGEAKISTAPRRLSRISEGVSLMRTNFVDWKTAGEP